MPTEAEIAAQAADEAKNDADTEESLEEGSEEQTPTPGAEEGASGTEERLDPNVYDEEGVPWKNRAKEFQRKHNSLLEKTVERFEAPPKAGVRADADDEDLEPEDVEKVNRILSRREQQAQAANAVLTDVLDEIATEVPEIMDMKADIAERLSKVDVSGRLNPHLVNAIAMSIYGTYERNQRKAKKTAPAVKRKLVRNGSEVLAPSAKGGNTSEIDLTSEEDEYATTHRLYDNDFSNEEIRDMYAKSQGKKKK